MKEIIGGYITNMKKLANKAYGCLAAMAVVSGLMMPVDASAKEAEAASGDVEYYEVPPLIVPVVGEKGAMQQVSLAISLEVPPGKKDVVSAYGPRLVDAYISDLFGALGSGQVMMRGNMVDVTKIKTRLTSVTERVLGDKKENMKGLLLQAVQQRPI